jgi:hypothetical protein
MPGIGIMGAGIIGFIIPPIIMGIGIIRSLGSWSVSCRMSEKKLLVSYWRDEMHRGWR